MGAANFITFSFQTQLPTSGVSVVSYPWIVSLLAGLHRAQWLIELECCVWVHLQTCWVPELEVAAETLHPNGTFQEELEDARGLPLEWGSALQIRYGTSLCPSLYLHESGCHF
jgi:hypothetical protein